MAVARDGRIIVANSNDPVVRLLDPATGRVKESFTADETGVAAVAFSSDAKTVATGSGVAEKSGEVRFWDAATWKRRDTLAGHADVIETIAFSADDRRLATGAHDRTVILWDLTKRKPLVTTFPCWKDVTPPLRFTPGGKTLLAPVRSDKDTDKITGMEIMEWDLADATPNHVPHFGPAAAAISALAFSPDGNLVATANFWGECDVSLIPWRGAGVGIQNRLKKMNTVKPYFLRGKPPGRDRSYTVLEFSPDSSALLAGGSDGSVELWDITTGRLRAAFGGQGYTFLLRSPTAAGKVAQKPLPPPSMRAVREANGNLIVQILRNTTRLREVTLPATQIADGPLHLNARRDGNQFTFRVNQLAAVEFEDMVPLRAPRRAFSVSGGPLGCA